MNHKLTISLYWKCQLLGWSLAALYWGYQGYLGGGFNWWLGILQFVTDIVIYVLITHFYRHFSLRHHFQDLPLKQLMWRMIPAVIVLGIVYTGVTTGKIYLIRIIFIPEYSFPYNEFFRQNVIPIFMAGVRLMSIWLLAYHLYQYTKRELKATQDNARLEIISREAQLNNLSAQLNPHFLFNSLNNIKALVADDPQSARRAIDLLSDILRSGLYSGENCLTTFEDELSLVSDYLELEKLRFEERLNYDIRFDDSLRNMLIPRFSIQLLVENAVKHGIAKLEAGGLEAYFVKTIVQT
jgi:heme/copper-type cytochrome/quinol oxidase subunit 2